MAWSAIEDEGAVDERDRIDEFVVSWRRLRSCVASEEN